MDVQKSESLERCGRAGTHCTLSRHTKEECRRHDISYCDLLHTARGLCATPHHHCSFSGTSVSQRVTGHAHYLLIHSHSHLWLYKCSRDREINEPITQCNFIRRPLLAFGTFSRVHKCDVTMEHCSICEIVDICVDVRRLLKF